MFVIRKLKAARMGRQLVVLLAAVLMMVACQESESKPATSAVTKELVSPTSVSPAITATTHPPPATLTPITSSQATSPIPVSECLFSPYGIGGEVPVFALPDWDSPVIDEIVRGDRYIVLERDGEWYVEGNNTRGQYYLIQLSETTSGWVIDMRGGLEGSCADFQDDKVAPAFGIYLLAADMPATQLADHDLDSLTLQEQPLIGIDDIVSYDADTHRLKLSSDTYSRIQEIFPIPVRVDGIPFVVRVGEEPIYAGGFWTPLSSLSYDGVIIMQPFEEQAEVIGLSLGYPSPSAFTGEDPRGDPRIMDVLEAAGKLN